MGWASERKAIETRLTTNWTTTPIKFDGVPFEETRNPYLACTVVSGDRNPIDLSNTGTVRSIALVIVQIFIPADTGMALAKTYADSIAAIFDRAQFFTDDGDLISCQVARAEYAGHADGWGQFNVTVPYTRDEN